MSASLSFQTDSFVWGPEPRVRPLSNPPVASLDEVNRKLPIRPVDIDACWERRGGKVLERREESHHGAIIGHQVLQQEIRHVSMKVLE